METRPYSRSAQRHPMNLRVEVDNAVGVTRDVSSHGVYFELDRDYAPGAPIEFVIALESTAAATGGAPVRLRCSGEVVRIEPITDRANGIAATITEYTLVS